MILEILAFVIGLVYGYAKPGKEKRWELLKRGIVYGIILGLIFGFFGLLMGGLVLSVATAIGTVVKMIVLTIIFIVGTFFGDLLETVVK